MAPSHGVHLTSPSKPGILCVRSRGREDGEARGLALDTTPPAARAAAGPAVSWRRGLSYLVQSLGLTNPTVASGPLAAVAPVGSQTRVPGSRLCERPHHADCAGRTRASGQLSLPPLLNSGF